MVGDLQIYMWSCTTKPSLQYAPLSWTPAEDKGVKTCCCLLPWCCSLLFKTKACYEGTTRSDYIMAPSPHPATQTKLNGLGHHVFRKAAAHSKSILILGKSPSLNKEWKTKERMKNKRKQKTARTQNYYFHCAHCPCSCKHPSLQFTIKKNSVEEKTNTCCHSVPQLLQAVNPLSPASCMCQHDITATNLTPVSAVELKVLGWKVLPGAGQGPWYTTMSSRAMSPV